MGGDPFLKSSSCSTIDYHGAACEFIAYLRVSTSQEKNRDSVIKLYHEYPPSQPAVLNISLSKPTLNQLCATHNYLYHTSITASNNE